MAGYGGMRYTLRMAIDAFVDHLAATLDPASRTPLYEQLSRAIAEAIYAGRLPPGAMLPAEPTLAARLGVSRQTVNQALTALARRGLVIRRRGVGTVVVGPQVEQPLGALYSFLRTLLAQGRVPATRVLACRATVDVESSPLLTGRPDGEVFEITRLRLVDGEPFAVETIHLPLACGERLPLDRIAQEALYDVLQDVCGLVVTQADETLRPVTLEPLDADLLSLPVGDPAFLVERVGYAGQRPVEVRRSLIRGDRYRFRVHLAGPSLAANHD